MKIKEVMLLGCVLALAGCGGGGSSTTPANNSSALSGNWQMTFTGTKKPPSFTQSGFMVQNGNSLVATLTANIQAKGTCSQTTISLGTVNGSQVSLSIPIGAISLTGMAAADFTSMSGTFSEPPGACTAKNGDDGTWNAYQIKPLAGNFSGTLTSTCGSSSCANGIQDGQTFTLSGTVTQGPNTMGASTAQLSGTITSDSPCLPGGSGSINGTISGTAVLLYIYSAGGQQIGAITQRNSGGYAIPAMLQLGIDQKTPSGLMAVYSLTQVANSACAQATGVSGPGDSGNVNITFP
jgi:hypothetical protein